MLPIEEKHESEVFCPYHRGWIKDDFIGDYCPVCHKRIRSVCVICGKEFLKEEIGSLRQCCYNQECLRTFRYHCGKGDRYWRKQKDIERQKRTKENREKRKNAEKETSR